MFTLILKTLWARRRRNGWLLAELILVAVLSWIIFDPVIVVTYDRHLPLGYDADRLCMFTSGLTPISSRRMASALGRAARRRSSCRTMPTRNRISS